MFFEHVWNQFWIVSTVAMMLRIKPLEQVFSLQMVSGLDSERMLYMAIWIMVFPSNQNCWLMFIMEISKRKTTTRSSMMLRIPDMGSGTTVNIKTRRWCPQKSRPPVHDLSFRLELLPDVYHADKEKKTTNRSSMVLRFPHRGWGRQQIVIVSNVAMMLRIKSIDQVFSLQSQRNSWSLVKTRTRCSAWLSGLWSFLLTGTAGWCLSCR